jgi:hypothetical protein
MKSPAAATPEQTCKGCIHFFVTYELSFPYGCRGLGFKSKRHPWQEVQAASGAPCQMRQTAVNSD